MASSTKHFSLSLLSLILLSSLHRTIHARDSRLFNKVPASGVFPNSQQPQSSPQQEQQPDFLPQNEYGNGHAYGEHYPSSAAHERQSLPKNYKPVAYANEANDVYYGDRNYNYDPAGENSEIGNNFPTAANGWRSANKNYYNNGGGGGGGFGNQGMSDTRYLEGGKYFYDLKSDSYSRNHPYNSRNNYLDGENGNEFNGGRDSVEGFKDQFGFQDEADTNLP